jgi:tetratricopeptide (TPR) repeat protein
LRNLGYLSPRDPRRSWGRTSIVGFLVFLLAIEVAVAQPAPLDLSPLVTDLGSPDRAVVERSITALERIPPTDDNALASALFRAAQTCEDVLSDPSRALALYERIVREHPTSRLSMSAERKVATLRGQVGAAGEHAPRASELARIIAEADKLPPDDIERRARALIDAEWPGAPDAAAWLAEWLRRTGRLDEAQQAYARVVAKWPGTKHGLLALRGGAGNALDRRDWDLTESLAAQLPAHAEADRIMRDDLLRLAARGRRIDGWYTRAWVAALLGFVLMIASLLEAARRGGWRRPRVRPPIEVVFLAPVAAVMMGVALTTHQLIAPAVLMLSLSGIALAWVSGATLDTLRARGREIRGRALAHVAICFVTVAALFYVALVRDNLLEMVIETVRFGPEP